MLLYGKQHVLVGNGDIKDDLIWAPHAQGKTQISQLEQIRTAAADHGCVSVSSATTVLGTLAVKWVRHTRVVLWLGVLGAPHLHVPLETTVLQFLSDPGIPGVRSMGPSLCH